MYIHLCDLCGKDLDGLAVVSMEVERSSLGIEFTPDSPLRNPKRLDEREICEDCAIRITTVISTALPITTAPVESSAPIEDTPIGG